MTDTTIIQRIIKNKAIVADKKNFTYVSRLFSEFEDNTIVLICKRVGSPANSCTPKK